MDAGLGGLVAGLITTVAGIGGGIVLIALLSGFLDPRTVVGLTAPVLAVGNASRVAMFRRRLDAEAVIWVLAGAVPTALLGAFLLKDLPARAIQVGMAVLLLGFVTVELARRLRRRGRGVAVHDAPEEPIAAWFGLPVGLVLGGLSAVVGGAGPISAPYLHARRLTKGDFAATNAATNGTVHAIKTGVFALTGVLTLASAPASALAAATVIVGNRVGKAVLGRISEETFVRLLLAALTVAAVRLLLVG